jgi:ABC-type lipoprotein export system ATPase subunit
MRLLTELHREGRTIVLVTHDEAVAAYARRELFIRDGTIASDRTNRQPTAASALRTA